MKSPCDPLTTGCSLVAMVYVAQTQHLTLAPQVASQNSQIRKINVRTKKEPCAKMCKTFSGISFIVFTLLIFSGHAENECSDQLDAKDVTHLFCRVK